MVKKKPKGSPEETEYGPLGPGRELEKDPFKGLRGVMAGIHIMEAIVVWLTLTVITRVDPEVNGTPGKIIFVCALGTAMVIAAFLQGRGFSLAMNIILQVWALLGFFVHPSIGFVAVLFAATWWYTYHLKKNLEERMRRGLLPAQHT